GVNERRLGARVVDHRRAQRGPGRSTSFATSAPTVISPRRFPQPVMTPDAPNATSTQGSTKVRAMPRCMARETLARSSLFPRRPAPWKSAAIQDVDRVAEAVHRGLHHAFAERRVRVNRETDVFEERVHLERERALADEIARFRTDD